MKNFIRTTVSICVVIACATTASAQTPFVIAGWDNWDDPTAPTATVVATDVVASATASAMNDDDEDATTGVNLVPVNFGINDSGSDPGRGSSGDTTWGTFDGNGVPASDVTDMGTANLSLTNAKIMGEITMTITNNGATDLSLDAFHMDAVAFRPRAARIYSLDVLPGSDITVGNVFASAGEPMNDSSTNDITSLNGALGTSHDVHDDLDIDMTGLADNILATGETAIIQINFTGGGGDGSGGHHLFVDNVAFSSGFVVATPGVPGDFNEDGVVDCADLDGYIGNIGAAATGTLAALDIDGDGTLSAADASTHITTLVVTMPNGVTGTFPGDLNCDGTVNVLGDAFALVGNLGNAVTSYSQGDINFDGTVNVLGDAFALVGNLGMSNQ
jgi:hypothetical protein